MPAIHLRVRDQPAATREVRAAIDRLADECGIGEEVRFDLKVAGTEALTNALKRAPHGDAVDVAMVCRGGTIDIELRHQAGGRLLAREHELDAEGGRGIPLMLALVDEVEFAATGDGTRVRMRKRVTRTTTF
jgi:anti-sigma regulatory factor (Ser/Thr protein kinase)